MSMKKEDYLKLVNDLEKKLPKPSEDDFSRTRWFSDFLSLMELLKSELGQIDESIFNEFGRNPTRSLFSGTNKEKENYAWEQRCIFFKNSMVLVRDWIERKFLYRTMTNQRISPKREASWFYYANGKDAWALICGTFFRITDPKQTRKNFGAHLMDLLSLPNREGVVMNDQLKRRLSEQQITFGGKSDPFIQAIKTINKKVGKSPSGREFIKLTPLGGCCVDEEYLHELTATPLTQA